MGTTELTTKTTGDAAISSQRRQINPAALYLLTLSEGSSRDGMEQILKRTARFFGFADWTDCPWQTITAAHVIGYRAILQKQGKSPATVNLVLAAIKGVVRCAWQENLISDHERMVIDSIKSVKGSRVSKCSVRMNLHSMLLCPELNLLKKRWQKPTTRAERITTMLSHSQRL